MGGRHAAGPPCTCGHTSTAHNHYRPGSDCGACGSEVCPAYTPTPRRKRSRRGLVAAVVAVVLGGVALLTGCDATTPATAVPALTPVVLTPDAAPPPPAPPDAPGDAAAALAALPVKGRASMTGYTRAQYGPAWADVDGNGCNTRDDILRRDLGTPVVGADGCTVLSGTLADPYTGVSIAFQRGPRSGTVQIDHVVALGDAWQTGAQQLTPDQRKHLANDHLNLLAVSGTANEAKGDADAASWLPPVKGYRCAYVARQVAVKALYGLWLTQAEHDAIAGVLAACPGQPLPQ